MFGKYFSGNIIIYEILKKYLEIYNNIIFWLKYFENNIKLPSWYKVDLLHWDSKGYIIMALYTLLATFMLRIQLYYLLQL